jgi:hypothetical protein
LNEVAVPGVVPDLTGGTIDAQHAILRAGHRIIDVEVVEAEEYVGHAFDDQRAPEPLAQELVSSRRGIDWKAVTTVTSGCDG